MRLRRIFGLAFVLLVLASLGAGGVWLHDQLTFVTTTDARVRTRMVTISADIAGRIVAMPVRAGDRVDKDSLIVRLDDERARLSLAATTLELKALEIRIGREGLNADVAQARGGERVAAQRSAMDAAAAEMAAAKALLSRTEREHERALKLHAAGVIAQAAMDRADGALEAARQDAARAEAALAASRAALGEAVADTRTADVARRDADALAMAAHALRQRVALLKVELQRHVVASPVDGVIDEVFADVGEHVSPGARLALAHADDDLWMEANIKETDLPRIRAGAAVEIRLDAARTACHGVVERIGDAATSEFALIPNANPAGVFTKITQRVPVRIRMGADCREARPGAMATLRIRAA